MATTGQTAGEGAAALQEQLRGEYIARDAAGYDEARAVYNAMIDKRPAGIARCDRRRRRARGRPLRRRPGPARRRPRRRPQRRRLWARVDDGLVIDLSLMDGVIVDPIRKTAQVQGGATLGAVDHATHAFGLAVPGGIISTTGIGGLTLGGGLGHLTRGCGLTIDNLLAANVVLADGSFLTASADENPDLFWALRGGGGNFGVVTSFTFACHDVRNVIAGPVLYDLDDAPALLAWWREFGPAQPDELGGFFAFLSVPPGPPFPEELHLRKVCAILWCYGGREEDPACLREARAFGRPLLDGVQPVPLPAWQSAFDGVYPPGDQWYWRADFVKELPDEAIEQHIEARRGDADLEVDDAPVPDRRRRLARAERCDAVGLPRREVGPGHRRRRSRPGQRRRDPSVVRRLLGGHPSVLDGRRVRELHDG